MTDATGPEAHAEPRPARVPFDAIRLGGEIQRRIGAKTVRDEILARHTTMRVGGPADLYVVVHNAFELRALVRFVRTRGIPHFLLGRGSDIVVSDAGIRGVVIHVRAEGLEIAGDALHRQTLKLARVRARPHQRPDVVLIREEPPHERPADEPGGAGHEGAHVGPPRLPARAPS